MARTAGDDTNVEVLEFEQVFPSPADTHFGRVRRVTTAGERDKGGRPPASLELPSERTCQEEILFRFLLASQEQCPLDENV
jgi:hypothetical protein